MRLFSFPIIIVKKNNLSHAATSEEGIAAVTRVITGPVCGDIFAGETLNGIGDKIQKICKISGELEN